MPEYLHPFIAVRRCYTAICRPGKASIFKVGIIIADLVQEFLARGIQKWNQFLNSKLCLLVTETVFQSEISLSFKSFKLCQFDLGTNFRMKQRLTTQFQVSIFENIQYTFKRNWDIFSLFSRYMNIIGKFKISKQKTS